MFEIFDGHVSGLNGLLRLLLIETVQVLLVLWLVLTFLFEDLCIRPLRRFLITCSRLSLVKEWLLLGGVSRVGLRLRWSSFLLCSSLVNLHMITILCLNTAKIPIVNFGLYLLNLLALTYDHTL